MSTKKVMYQITNDKGIDKQQSVLIKQHQIGYFVYIGWRSLPTIINERLIRIVNANKV